MYFFDKGQILVFLSVVNVIVDNEFIGDFKVYLIGMYISFVVIGFIQECNGFYFLWGFVLQEMRYMVQCVFCVDDIFDYQYVVVFDFVV